jgi:rRNA N6-adenosine-methyltransferase METTL5
MFHLDALMLAQQNIVEAEVESCCDLVQADIQSVAFKASSSFDTIVTNPPFGTRNRGIDTLFIEKAMENASVVYSLHKSSTRNHFIKKAKEKEWQLEMVAELRYDLPKTHVFHKQKSKDIQVDLYRFSHQR